jgi:sugar (pentulose or hexulose) kinase
VNKEMIYGSRETNIYVLGIDVGTSGTKAVLMDTAGKIIGQGYKGYRFYSEGNRIEQDIEDWWEACISAVRQAVSGGKAGGVKAVSLSTQGATMAALDENGKPIGRAITWMDTRAQTEADRLESLLGKGTIYRICGWRGSPSHDAAKISWMKNHNEYREARLYVSTIEYMNLRLTGQAVIDPTNAAIRQLYNVNTGYWDERLLSAVRIDEDELPKILKTGDAVGFLTEESAEALGLNKSVKVYNGAHDQYCASIGCGAVNAGDMLVSAGTAWVLMAITERPIFSDTYISPCPHPVEGLYGNIASLAGIGASYQWIKDTYFPNESFSSIDEKAASEIPKCAGLYFLPWLAGAGYPVWNLRAKGGFVGMDFANTPYSMALAIMESAVFSLKNAISDFENNGFKLRTIKIMGGAIKSPVWLDMLAAVIDIPCYKMEVTDSCALGAAFIAAYGEGWYKDYVSTVAVKGQKIRETTLNKKFYWEKFQRYNETISFMKKLYQQGDPA